MSKDPRKRHLLGQGSLVRSQFKVQPEEEVPYERGEMVEMVTCYTKRSDGSVHERVTVGSMVLYDGPARVVFVQFKPPLPWEGPQEGI